MKCLAVRNPDEVDFVWGGCQVHLPSGVRT